MLQSLLSSPKTTGAIAVYSNSAIKNMLQHQDRKNIRTIVEFGPGLGNITQYILDNIHITGTLKCFEINKTDFGPYLDALQDDRLTIHYTSCEHIIDYCDPGSVDLIISTIPLSFIDTTIVNTILQNSYLCLRPSGVFITGQYSTYAKSLMNTTFHNISTRRHLRNIPPVCILTSTK